MGKGNNTEISSKRRENALVLDVSSIVQVDNLFNNPNNKS